MLSPMGLYCLSPWSPFVDQNTKLKALQQLSMPTEEETIPTPLSDRVYRLDKGYQVQEDPEFVDELIRSEGFRQAAYPDKRGIPTIGIGANLKTQDARESAQRLGYDPEELISGKARLDESDVYNLLDDQLEFRRKDFEKIRKKFFPNSDITPNEERALRSLHFNARKLIGPSLKRALESNDDEAAAKEILLNSNRKNDPGLQARREREAKMFMGDRFEDFIKSLSKEELQTLAKKRGRK